MKIELRRALELKYNDFIGATFEELVLPEGMTEIPGSLCEDCRQLRKVVLPSTIKRIDVGAFNGCIKLEEINLPDGLEEIADDVFQGCHALRHIILPPGLKRLSPEIFDNSGLESIELPDGLESIGYWAFYGCNSLKIACISNNAYVKTISVKQSVELTTEDAFAFDMGLKEIDFQGGVTGITKDTFYLCNYPDKIIIKNNV